MNWRMRVAVRTLQVLVAVFFAQMASANAFIL